MDVKLALRTEAPLKILGSIFKRFKRIVIGSLALVRTPWPEELNYVRMAPLHMCTIHGLDSYQE